MNLTHWKQAAADVGHLVIRLPGFYLALGHGWGKVHGLATGEASGFAAGVAALGFPFPDLFAWAAALAEFAGGLLVGLGLYARVGAAFASFTMVVAAFAQHRAHAHLLDWLGFVDVPAATLKAWGNPELALTYLAPLLGVLLLGSGPLSIDRFIGRKGKG